MEKVNQLDKANKDWDEISIVLTDNIEISDINQRYLSSSEATDVISFRYDPLPGVTETRAGEVIVNVQRAVDVAATEKETSEVNWNASKELALYIAHGCDHLSGATDHDKKGRSQMRHREMLWLEEAEKSGLLEELLNH